MKKLRKLSRKQKVFLSKEGYDPMDYLLERNTTEKTVYVNIHSGEELKIEK